MAGKGIGDVGVGGREMLEMKRIADFAACFRCGMRQWKWRRRVAAEDDGRRFQMGRGESCQ